MLREVGRRLDSPTRAGLDLDPDRGHAPRRSRARNRNEGASRCSRFHRGAPWTGIFHLKDFHEPFAKPRKSGGALRDMYASCDGQGNSS